MTTSGRHINQRGIDLIKQHEGLVTRLYRDPVGLWTIGFGHLVKKGETFPARITVAEAEAILREDLADAESAVERNITAPLTDNQFAALVSFAFNLGETKAKGSSAFRAANAKNFAAVPRYLAMWNKGRIRGKLVVLPGLVRRRREEGELFATPDGITSQPAVAVIGGSGGTGARATDSTAHRDGSAAGAPIGEGASLATASGPPAGAGRSFPGDEDV